MPQERPHPSSIRDKLDLQRQALLQLLDSEKLAALQKIAERSEHPEKTSIDLSSAFTPNTVRIIRRIHEENDEPLLYTLRRWALEELQVVIKADNGDFVLDWSDPRIFSNKTQLNDGTGE